MEMRLKEALEKGGMNQYRLAKALGVSPQQVHKWHRGWHIPRPKTLEKICKLLGVTESELIHERAS